MIIIDTDILIDTSRGISDAVECLQEIEAQSRLAVSAVTEMELIIGCRDKRELRILSEFLGRFEIVSVNEVVSEMAVALLKHYRLSHGLLIADALIAATAMSLSTSLVSKNQKDYRFIEGLDLLAYPNPFQNKQVP